MSNRLQKIFCPGVYGKSESGVLTKKGEVSDFSFRLIENSNQ